MHPEIVQIGPGNCPECGMALEPRDFADAPRADEPGELRSMQHRLIGSAALTLPVFAIVMGEMLPGDPIGDALGRLYRGSSWP